MTSLSTSLAGKVALVTGATGGIGLSVCKSLAAQGVKIVVVDLNEEKCNALATELPTESAGFAINIADEKAVQEGMEKVFAKFEGVDILVNIAGRCRSVFDQFVRVLFWTSVDLPTAITTGTSACGYFCWLCVLD